MATAKKVSYSETVIRNLQTSERFYGFLPPHGKRLKANGDSGKLDYFTFKGDLESFIYRRKRYIDHFNTAITSGLIRVTENKRVVYYGTVANATAFALNDMVYWDDSAKLVKPASSLTWDTNLATTQANYANVHLGIALAAKTASDGTVVMAVDIGPASYYDLTIVAGTAYTIGDTFGPAKASGNALLANKIAKAVAASSVFRAMADAGSSATQVLVQQASVWVPINTAADVS